MKKVWILVFLLVALPVFSNEVQEHPTPDEGLKQVEDYFNSLSTYQAHFVQVTPGLPDIHTGTFYMERPRKFLWQYEGESNHKLVSTGSYLYFYDPDNEQVTQLPLNSGLAGFLTRKNFKLNEEGFTLEQYGIMDGRMEVTLKPEESMLVDLPLEQLTLSFRLDPFQLERMITADALGNRTFTTFSQVQEGHALNKKLFWFEPNVGQ